MAARQVSAIGGAAVLTAHNLEEGIVTPFWVRAHPSPLARLFSFMGEPVPRLSQSGLCLALVVVTVLSVAWVVIGARSAPRSFLDTSVAGLFGMYAGNAFVPHIAGAVLLGGYVPGAVTATLLVLPFTLVLFVVGVREGRFTAGWAAVAFIAGVVLYAALGFGLQSVLTAGPSAGA